MRVSHFASIHVVVPPNDYTGDTGGDNTGVIRSVGMAQNLNIDDNFGSRAQNVLGTPMPILAPGYQVTNIRLEKATIDGSDFRNLGAFNPLWAHVGQTYRDENLIQMGAAGVKLGVPDTEVFPFLFILGVRNKVAKSYSDSNIDQNNNPASLGGQARSNPFGVYACVLQSANISMSSQQAVIMDSVNAIARPVKGTWLTQAVREAYDKDAGGHNGMSDLVTSLMFGYRS